VIRDKDRLEVVVDNLYWYFVQVDIHGLHLAPDNYLRDKAVYMLGQRVVDIYCYRLVVACKQAVLDSMKEAVFD
jgi:hypothetical protein